MARRRGFTGARGPLDGRLHDAISDGGRNGGEPRSRAAFWAAHPRRPAGGAATLHGPGGIAAVDVWLPEPDDLARFDGRLIFEYERREPETGHRVTKLAAARFDPTTAIVDLTAIYEEGPDGGSTIRWIRRDALRLIGPDDLVSMAEDAGLVVEQIGGSYDLDPIGLGSERAVLIARRPDEQGRVTDRGAVDSSRAVPRGPAGDGTSGSDAPAHRLGTLGHDGIE